jgi:DNA-binding LacI/PurR family transcriptional regulator
MATTGVGSGRPTLRDVARVAGVSVSTASMALRSDPRTAAATRDAVRAAADKLAYVPDSMGRGLRARRSGAVALVIPHSGQHLSAHTYYLELLHGILDRCNVADLTLLLSTSPVEHDEATPYLRILHSRAADGAIVASAGVADRNVLKLAASGFPTVFIGRFPDQVQLETVGVDDRLGALLATDHLIEAHRCSRIAHLAGPMDALAAVDRLDGYRTSLARHGIVFREELVFPGNFDQESGEATSRDLLASGRPFDAIFAANDEMAAGALRVLRDAGIRVPEDVAMVGFDDLLLARALYPALTTVHQPVRDLGWAAASRLLELLGPGPSPGSQQALLTVELVLRKSCGCGA